MTSATFQGRFWQGRSGARPVGLGHSGWGRPFEQRVDFGQQQCQGGQKQPLLRPGSQAWDKVNPYSQLSNGRQLIFTQ